MMNDRGPDLELEERVARVLRGRLRDTQIPPFTAIEKRLQRRARLPLEVSAAVLILLLAFVMGNALAGWRGAAPAAVPSAAATATPQGTPNPSGVLSERFGFVWAQEPSGTWVRPETGQGGFQLLARPYGFSLCSCAVSPDGTRIAYWSGGAPGGVELMVLDVARPTQQATIYTAPEDQRVSAAAWSSDGSGIIFSLEAVTPAGGPDSGPSSSALLVIEASGGTARTLIESSQSAPVYVPLGWDRQAGIAAVGESGPGGYMRAYVTVHTSGDPALRRIVVSENIYMLSVNVSTDQRFVLGVFFDQSGGTLRWWKLADFGSMVSGPRIGSLIRAKWRPLTSEIAWIDRGELQLLDVQSGKRSANGAFPPGDYALGAFRPDGSAVLATAGTSNVVLDVASGRTAIFDAKGLVVASVRFP